MQGFFRFKGKFLDIKSSRQKDSIICCPKKNIKRAVRRNRLKRILRICLKESFGQSLYIRVLKDPQNEDGQLLREEWRSFLHQWQSSGSSSEKLIDNSD